MSLAIQRRRTSDASEPMPLELVVVKRRSVIAKINRRLERVGRQLRCGSRVYGRYYVVDRAAGEVIERHVDLESLGRKVGAMSRRKRRAS